MFNIIYNFDEDPDKTSLFDESDVRTIVRFIEIEANMKIIPGRTLLFLDEIQAAPPVLAKLRYFYEKMPELHVVCAGSLLDFALCAPEYSVPVGRIEFMYLGPMSFGEFVLVRGQGQLWEFLGEYRISMRLPEATGTGRARVPPPKWIISSRQEAASFPSK